MWIVPLSSAMISLTLLVSVSGKAVPPPNAPPPGAPPPGPPSGSSSSGTPPSGPPPSGSSSSGPPPSGPPPSGPPPSGSPLSGPLPPGAGGYMYQNQPPPSPDLYNAYNQNYYVSPGPAYSGNNTVNTGYYHPGAGQYNYAPPPPHSYPSYSQTIAPTPPSNNLQMMMMMKALGGGTMDLSTMMMMSMMTGPGGPAEGAMPGGMNPMMLMHMMNGGNGMDLSSMVLMQVMMGGGQLDPMTMFALMQQDQGSTSDKIQSYLDKQWKKGKRKLSVNVNYGNTPLEYNFLNLMHGFPNPQEGNYMDPQYLQNMLSSQGLFGF